MKWWIAGAGVALLLGLSQFAAAQPFVWTVTDSAFQTHVGQLKSVSASALELTRDDGVSESLPMFEVLRWSRPVNGIVRSAAETPELRSGQTVNYGGVAMTITATNATAVTLQAADGRQIPMATSEARQLLAANAARNRRGPLALILANGDVLTGEPVALDNGVLSWKNDLLGEIKVPLDQARRLLRLPDHQPPTTAPAEDIALLANGDSVRGVVSALSSESLTMQPLSGDPTPLPLESLKQLRFAQTSADVPSAQRGFVVGLVDGSHWSVATVASTPAGWALSSFDGATKTIPVGNVQQVEQRNDAVVWLSDLTPTESIQRSFLGLQWPAQFNRAVDGEPLRFASQAFAHGIGVHSFSKLVFDLPIGFDRLHLNYSIQGDAPYADVTVRVFLDEQLVHQATHVHAGNLAAPSDIPLGSAQQLTLEVDFGEAQDTQDRFEWIEPALLHAPPK